MTSYPSIPSCQTLFLMINRLLLLFLLGLQPIWASSQPSIQRSHIEANVPPAESFDLFLKRDLLAYLRANGYAKATGVEYVLLRNQPTQSGLSYPKYYVWISARAGGAILVEGAVRLEAIDRTHFEVTHLQSSEEIRGNPGRVGEVFPSPLVSDIRNRAGVR
jgi:hypothetical protein